MSAVRYAPGERGGGRAAESARHGWGRLSLGGGGVQVSGCWQLVLPGQGL